VDALMGIEVGGIEQHVGVLGIIEQTRAINE
jgi:hypothetical protein